MSPVRSTASDTVMQSMDCTREYIERITGDVMIEHKIKVVVDCGNGIPGAVAPAVLEGIGCEVLPLYCDVDGNFPNHHPDPSDPHNLQDLIMSVKQMNADLGLAFDGSGSSSHGWTARTAGNPARFNRSIACRTRRGELMRSPHPHPSGMTCPNRSATSGGTSRIGPATGCDAHADVADTITDPTIFSGAMLASSVKPSSTRVSSAHSDRSFTDHSGARKQRTSSTPAACSASRCWHGDRSGRRTVELVDALVPMPCDPIS